jgi:phosphatidylglycerol:prolipoprotein diacylglycerol transferase
MAAGVASGVFFASRAGLPVDRTYLGYLLLLVPALLGARVLHLLKHWGHYRARPDLILSRTDSGLALYGGLILSLLLSWPLLAALKLPAAPFWDGGAVVILVGMTFAKVGCHLNGCCAGRPTTSRWGVSLRRDRGRVRRTPTQLLESLLAVMLLAILVPLSPRLGFSGALFWCACLGYATGRFFLEGMRESFDRKRRFNSNRWISVVLAGCAAAALFLGSG